jgi:hypothetical protein
MYQIIQEISAHIQNCGPASRSEWYVGIAYDPHQSLFTRHSVHPQNDSWIYRLAANDNEARAIESYFVAQGFDGGPGGGSSNTRYVYAFRKTRTTKR